MNSHEVCIHIHQGCFAGTGAIVRLPQCQWSKPGGYGKISQCITTTKHSKTKNVCIFLGKYCMGCTANIIIKDIIHIFASFCKIMCIFLMGWHNRECCLYRKNGIFLLKCSMDEIHLIHWGWDRMTTIFWKAVSWMKMYEFQLKFHSLFLRVELIIFHHCVQ